MESIDRLNNVIHYIEENLCDEINYNEICKITLSPISSFQNFFYLTTGIALSEYIRRRKLYLAAYDLKNTKNKIIDIALKYGYKSPDAFNVAFKRAYNVTPSTARKENMEIEPFHRLYFDLSIKYIEGGFYFMKKESKFNYPFSNYDHLSFLNCFTSVYMFLEKIEGIELKECVKERGKRCCGCKGCDDIWYDISFRQESLFCVFGTMSGVNSFRPDFDGLNECKNDTEEIIDFTFKFTGYEYETLISDFTQRIKVSIDNKKPVLACVKNDDKNRYRVIIGYDDDKFLIAENGNIKNDPENPLTGEDFSSVIIIKDKVKPLYTLLDALKRIRTIMQENEEKAIWDGYIKKFRYWDEKLQDADFGEIKRRFDRIEDTMWYNFNTHAFAEAFCRQMWDLVTKEAPELEDERFLKIIRTINETYSAKGFHDHNWQLHALNKNRDWSVRHTGQADWAYCGCVVQTLEALKKYDEIVLNEINEAIKLLSN